MPDRGPERVWRILVAAPFPPRLDGRHGGSRAVGQLLARLAERHRVALLALRGDDEPGVDDVLRDRCDLVEEVAIPPVGTSLLNRLAYRARLRTALVRGVPTWAAARTTPAFRERLEALASEWRPDVVQLEYRIVGIFLPALSSCPAPRILVDMDPVRTHEGRRGPVAALEARAWTSLGRTVSEQVDALVVLTERDRELISEVSGSTPIVQLPLAYDAPDTALDPAGRNPPGIVYVGSFIHPPNVDAAFWLAREIFPSVRARVPGALLRLVGSHGSPEELALDGEGIELNLDVPDVRPYLDAAAVVAAPIRQGGGMRVKVLEALASGKAVVATSLALEGLDLRDGEHLLVADDAATFADRLVELLSDRGQRTRMATAARSWAKEHLGMDAQLQRYEALYEALCDRRAPAAVEAGWAGRSTGEDAVTRPTSF
jgi:glycosyltransferase involved in cell wall biosynthesis